MTTIQRLAVLARRRDQSPTSEVICHVITTLGTGGAQRQLFQHLRNSEIDRSNLVVLVLWRQSGVVLQEILGLGVSVIHLEGAGGSKKATVFFPEVGQKQLLLKFAKLKII